METETTIDMKTPVTENVKKTSINDPPRTYSSAKSVKDVQSRDKDEPVPDQNGNAPTEKEKAKKRAPEKKNTSLAKKYSNFNG